MPRGLNIPQRPHIKFVPRFEGAIKGHSINMIRRFYPSLCAEHEFDDLLQEAYIVFMKCKSKYSASVDNAGWFMSLFKISLRNKLINLVALTGRYISLEDLAAEDEPATNFDEAYLRCILLKLPSRVRRQIGIFLNGSLREEREAYRLLRKTFPDAV